MSDEAKRTAAEWVEANAHDLSAWHQTIWGYAEPAWREYKSAAFYVDLLRRQGFEVEEGSGGMPTAFCARWGKGGPVLGAYAEYDAVPGNSQQAVPHRAPREGLHHAAAGHTDPHSALGIGVLGGVLAAKAAMERHDLSGTIKFFGEPAEKVCGSKPVHAAKGYYDDLEAAISFHPAYYPTLSNTVNWDTHCGSYWSVLLTFECVEPETWTARRSTARAQNVHSVARAPGAIDAVCLMYTTTKYTRDSMLPNTGYWTMNEAILAAGQATADNLPPTFAQIQYAFRAPTLDMQEKIWRVLENNARHVAAITHCRLAIDWVTKTRPGLPNHAVAAITYRNLEAAGAPVYDEAARALGQAIQRNLGFEPAVQPFWPECSRLIAPQEAEALLREQLPAWQKNYTSDDYTDWTWHCPTARLYVGRAMLQAPYADYEYPDWVWNALGGMPACIDPTIMTAAKCIGTTLVELAADPEALQHCRAEFETRTGGGIGGREWLAPLLPRDFVAPTHHRWPEYVTTPRGEEWWIPTPPDGKAGNQ
jgi:aminobenzoyl-glutamate utilization protein B